MLATNHVLAGAALGHVSGNPVLGAVAGLVSHLVMDAVPHWGGDDKRPLSKDRYLRVARTDGIVLLVVFAVLAVVTDPSVRAATLVGALAGLAPDIDKPWEHFFGRLTRHRPLYGRSFARFNAWLQRESPSLWWVELVAGSLLMVTHLRLAGLF